MGKKGGICVGLFDKLAQFGKTPEQLLTGLVEGWLREAYGGKKPPDLAPRLADLIRSRHPDVNTKDSNGNTPVLMLITGWTWLQSILWEERAEEINRCLKILLDHGATVDCRDVLGETPLLRVVKGSLELADRRAETIAMLQQASRFLKIKISKYPPQIKDIIEVLLHYGADPQAKDRAGKTALDYASAHGYREAADLLLTKSLDPRIVRELERSIKSQEATKALVTHCSGGAPLNPREIRGLLEKGADPNARDDIGYHVLVHVTGHGCSSTNVNDALESAKILLDYGADPNSEAVKQEGLSGFEDDSCVFSAVCSYRNADEAIQLERLLLDHGAKIKPGDNPYFSVLHGQRSPRDIAKVVRFLIDLGVNPNARNQLGQYPLDVAEELGLQEAASLLRLAKRGR